MNNSQFIEKSLLTKKGVLSQDGALIVSTGASTGRSTKERYVVKHPEIESEVNWGKANQPITPEMADTFFNGIQSALNDEATYDMNGFVGCFRVSVHSTSPWHIAFANNMFRERPVDSLKSQVPDDVEIKIYHFPYGQVSKLGLTLDYEKAIILDLHNKRIGIVGTAYAGEIKKSAFTMCNYLLPKYNIFPMHSSANTMTDGKQSAILFGLSGTGKTTLSADPKRQLIGDDEIIWSDNGLSNLEGGCYAKLIDLDPGKEPDIFRAANKFGSILENVQFDHKSREIDFTDSSITENTRGSYNLNSLSNVFDQTREADHPNCIIFLTADAFGALPAIAKLDEWQAQYHFISGYTAKVAGTEIGVTEPEATFSSCFGAPFMPRPCSVYGKLLAEMIRKHNVPVYLLNTGWVNGYGKGDRFPISVSRSLLTAIQEGTVEAAPMKQHPVFGFQVPTEVNGIDSRWLKIPEGDQVKKLAQLFQQNASQLKGNMTEEIMDRGGPIILND